MAAAMSPPTGTSPPRRVIGVIPVDSIYTPVRKVNYTVENTRVGNMTDFDKLTLEVWTDGTITARDAVISGRQDPVRSLHPVHRPVRDHGQELYCGGEGRRPSGTRCWS